MKREFEPIDLIVAVGACVTVLAAYFLFLSANGSVSVASSQNSTVGTTSAIDVMEWVQPVLGQAIVDDLLEGRGASQRIAAAARELNRDTLAAQSLQDFRIGFPEELKKQASASTEDHAARVQFVMGRSVVNFTARGIRTGNVSPERLDGSYNRRMIANTKTAGSMMDEAFQRNHQANLGNLIVATVHNRDRFAGQVQERVGQSVVLTRTTQARTEQKLGDVQEQLGATTMAAFLAERAPQPATTQASLPLSQPRSWPEIPVAVLLAFSALFVGIFCGGLWMSRSVVEPSIEAPLRLEAEEGRVYRKTA
jgi:hypothetical protein